MGTTTLTKAVLMIIRVIWFGANWIDTKAHDWLIWYCEGNLDFAPINSSVPV